MADKMYLVITLRKEVSDRDEARSIYEIAKQRMADKPDVEVTGHCSNHFDLDSD